MSTQQQSDLTTIDGVGPKTAEEIQRAGFSTARELYTAYLTDGAEAVEDAVRSVQGVWAGIHDAELTAGVAGDLAALAGMSYTRTAIMFMGFVRIFGVSSRVHSPPRRGYSPSTTRGPTNKYARPGEIDFDHAPFCNPANSVAITETVDLDTFPLDPEGMIEDMDAPVSVEPAVLNGVECHVFVGSDQQSYIHDDYLEKVGLLFGRDYTDEANRGLIRCVQDGPYDDNIGGPVIFDDPDTGCSILVAPRVQR